MLYAIHCLDHEEGLALRLAHYDAHKAYLASAAIGTVISGPLLAPDNETMIGSLFVVKAASMEDAVQFNRQDPFHAAGVWKTVQIHPFNMRVDNRG